MIQSRKSFAGKIGAFAIDNIVTLVFFVIVLFGVAVSGFTPSFIINEVVTRFFRNGLLVLSLVIPIIAGLGLNFGIVIGASLGLYAWKTLRASKEKERLDRREAHQIDRLKAEQLAKAKAQE